MELADTEGCVSVLTVLEHFCHSNQIVLYTLAIFLSLKKNICNFSFPFHKSSVQYFDNSTLINEFSNCMDIRMLVLYKKY
jgi:hypothetical protein